MAKPEAFREWIVYCPDCADLCFISGRYGEEQAYGYCGDCDQWFEVDVPAEYDAEHSA